MDVQILMAQLLKMVGDNFEERQEKELMLSYLRCNLKTAQPKPPQPNPLS